MKKVLLFMALVSFCKIGDARDNIMSMPIDCGDGRHYNYLPEGNNPQARYADYGVAKVALCS